MSTTDPSSTASCQLTLFPWNKGVSCAVNRSQSGKQKLGRTFQQELARLVNDIDQAVRHEPDQLLRPGVGQRGTTCALAIPVLLAAAAAAAPVGWDRRSRGGVRRESHTDDLAGGRVQMHV